MLVGVGDLFNDTEVCGFQDLVGVGDLKMPQYMYDKLSVDSNALWPSPADSRVQQIAPHPSR